VVLQALPWEQVAAAVRPLVTSAVVAAALVALVAMLLAVILGRRISKPLQQLARQVEAIGRGEFGVEVTSATGGEVAELMNSFNEMSAALKRREQEVERVQRLLIQSEVVNTVGRMTAAIAQQVMDPLERSLKLVSETCEKLPPDSEVADLQRQLFESINRAANVLQNLRRIPAGADDPPGEIEADLLLGDVMVSVKPLLEQNDLEAEVHVNGQVGEIRVSASQVHNTLLDLFLYVAENARAGTRVGIHLSRSGDQVTLGVSYAGDAAALDAADAGAGASPEEGPALALTVARMMLAEQGGQLEVAATESGSQLTVRLPVASNKTR